MAHMTTPTFIAHRTRHKFLHVGHVSTFSTPFNRLYTDTHGLLTATYKPVSQNVTISSERLTPGMHLSFLDRIMDPQESLSIVFPRDFEQEPILSELDRNTSRIFLKHL